MKLISASLLAASAMADKWAKLGDTWNALSGSNAVSEDDRKIIDLFTISSVANYGCWCRFNMYHPYKGTPQDTVDEACKQWYQNYDCLAVDYRRFFFKSVFWVKHGFVVSFGQKTCF